MLFTEQTIEEMFSKAPRDDSHSHNKPRKQKKPDSKKGNLDALNYALIFTQQDIENTFQRNRKGVDAQ